MTQKITTTPLTSAAFSPFGEVISAAGEPSFMINQGKCGRYHDLARPDVIGDKAAVNISVASSEAFSLPLPLSMVERHPLGSQAFIPMSQRPFLVVVAEDQNGTPARPVAFLTDGTQGVNYHRNVWHGVLTPLDKPQSFAIVDRIGEGVNLEEFFFETPFEVVG